MLLQERQERLKSLEARFSTKSAVMSSSVDNRNSYDGTGAGILHDISAGYIVNVVREEGEEAVRIPPSISTKLKIHQVWPGLIVPHCFLDAIYVKNMNLITLCNQ